MTTFDRIKETAKKQGLSLTDTAVKAGLGEKTIYKWKYNEPSASRLQAVADALNVSTDYLLGNTDNPSPAPNKATKTQDLADDDIVLTFEGKQIPPEDLEIMRRFLRGGNDDDK